MVDEGKENYAYTRKIAAAVLEFIHAVIALLRLCNLIITMLFQSVGADNGGRNDLAVLGIGAEDSLSSLPRSARHTRHSHELQLIRKTNYTCDGCKSQGCGLRYSCEQCSFNLHPGCMFSSPAGPAIRHELVGNPTFKFYYQHPKVCKCRHCHRNCEACAKPTKGYVYYEEGKENDKGIIFHPCCFKLPRKFSADGIEYELCKELSSNCRLCKRKQLNGAETGNTGWAYVSKGCKEAHNFHMCCTVRLLVKNYQKDGDSCSLVLRNNTIKKRRGKKISKATNSFLKIVLSFLPGPFSPMLEIVCLAYELASN